MSGVVKSIDDTTLTITPKGKNSTVSFALDATTSRAGTIQVGTPVSVRYHMNGSSRSAVSVTAHPAKQTASK